jgi:hypothetical protein
MLTPRQLAQIATSLKRATRSRGAAALALRKQAVKVYSRQASASMRHATSGPGGQFIRELSKAFAGGKIDSDSKAFADLLGNAAGGHLGTEIVRYARGGSAGSFLGSLLGQLGPVGKAVSMLLGRGRSTTGIPDAAIANAIKLLQSVGLEVRVPSGGGMQTHVPTGARGPTYARGTGPAKYPSLDERGQVMQTGRFVKDQYIGMTLVHGSSNVYAIGYAPETLTMRVQYLGATVSGFALRGRGHKGRKRVKGSLGRTVMNKRHGPGPVYDYKGVPQRVFDRISHASSKGKAIWDDLRVRGTVWGHKFDYELAAASMVDVVLPLQASPNKKIGRVTYVPRKAVGPGMFQSRAIKQGSSTFKSLLPSVGMRGRK